MRRLCSRSNAAAMAASDRGATFVTISAADERAVSR